MEYDESRAYTSLNANKLKIGSKVICADDLKQLKYLVETGQEVQELKEIGTENCTYRFLTSNNEFNLAYLVSEPEEKKLKCTDLKVGDVITDGKMECLVVTIDKSPNALFRICVILDGETWLSLSNDGVKDWRKVEK